MCSLSPKLNLMCMIHVRISAEDLLSNTGYIMLKSMSLVTERYTAYKHKAHWSNTMSVVAILVTNAILKITNCCCSDLAIAYEHTKCFCCCFKHNHVESWDEVVGV